MTRQLSTYFVSLGVIEVSQLLLWAELGGPEQVSGEIGPWCSRLSKSLPAFGKARGLSAI
jgi:hypothetical protein